MRHLADHDLEARFHIDNPWWATGRVGPDFLSMRSRAYFRPFCDLVLSREPRRAAMLMGPRRVGKTVLIHHVIQNLLYRGVHPQNIFYLSLDTPIYGGAGPEALFNIYLRLIDGHRGGAYYVFFDEIQYLRNWRGHLQSLVDTYRNTIFAGAGSAAVPAGHFLGAGSAVPALGAQGPEPGAGRLADFMLPPLSFAEFLDLTGVEEHLIVEDGGGYASPDIEGLNRQFVDYVNFGGYPEAALSAAVRQDIRRFIQGDIIDRAMPRDLPSLYGIEDVQELNRLFLILAFNTGREVSYTGLGKFSGLAGNTLRRYLHYLEAAFLIVRLPRVDEVGRRFERNRSFKVYLANPALRAALFGPVAGDDENMAALAESAIFSQWFGARFGDDLHYGRWKTGAVDLVGISKRDRRPEWAVDINWSDRFFAAPVELKGLLAFARKNAPHGGVMATTRSKTGKSDVGGVTIDQSPCSLFCYGVGKSVIEEIKTRQGRNPA